MAEASTDQEVLGSADILADKELPQLGPVPNALLLFLSLMPNSTAHQSPAVANGFERC